MKRLQRPLTTFIKSRGLSAAAAPKQVQQTGTKAEVELTALPNGIQVASIENNSPISRIAVLYHAGSRYETPKNAGITHAVRNTVGLTTANSSALNLVKCIEHEGGSLECGTTREHMIYSLTTPRTGLDSCMKMITQAACHPVFNFWEMDGQITKSKFDLGLLNQRLDVQMIEALHQAAYRNGLANSLYMPAYAVGAHDCEKLAGFVQEYYSAANMTLVGMGIDHATLTDLARKIAIQDGQKMTPDKATYAGGEVRVNNFSDIVHAAIVTECPGANSAKDCMAVSVLKFIMNAGSTIKYSNNAAQSRLNKAVASATSQPFSASSLMALYADSGLFGFQVTAQSSDMAGVLQAAVKAFADATKSITDADVQLAKSQLKSSLLMEMESPREQMEDLCYQVVTSGSFVSLDGILQGIDSVTTADVQSIAKKVINGKPSMAASGDLSNTPHLDQLL